MESKRIELLKAIKRSLEDGEDMGVSINSVKTETKGKIVRENGIDDVNDADFGIIKNDIGEVYFGTPMDQIQKKYPRFSRK